MMHVMFRRNPETEDHGEFVENMDHAEIAVSSSSSSISDPDCSQLRNGPGQTVPADFKAQVVGQRIQKSSH